MSTSRSGCTTPDWRGPREGEIGLLRDLQDLHVLATLTQTTWTVIAQGQGLRDRELLGIAQSCNAETSRQLSWFNTRMKAAAAGTHRGAVTPPGPAPGLVSWTGTLRP